MIHAKDYSGLLLLFTTAGNPQGLTKLAEVCASSLVCLPGASSFNAHLFYMCVLIGDAHGGQEQHYVCVHVPVEAAGGVPGAAVHHA